MSDITMRYLLFGEDKSASKAVEGVGDSGERAAGKIGSAFGKLGSTIGGETGEVLGRIGEGITAIGESSKGIGPKVAAGGIAVAGLGVALSTIGSKNVEAENALRAAVEATGHGVDDYADRIDRVVKANQNMAIGDDDTKKALAALTQMTGDTGKALDHMGLVTDLAAAKHISLDSAANLVGKAINGNTKLFKTYGIEVDSTSSAHNKLVKAQDDVEIASNAQKEALQNLHQVQGQIRSGSLQGADAQKALKAAQTDLAKANDTLATKQDKVKTASEGVKAAADEQKHGFDELSKKLDGSAKASVDSFTGRLQVLGTKIGDTVADMGAKYGPALQIAGVSATVFGTAMEFLRGRQAAQAVAAAASAAATATEAGATDAATASTWGLNAALLANPIGLIIIAIIALVALFVVLWTHSETFRSIVTGAFDAVWGAVKRVWDWIANNWPQVLGMLAGPIGIAVGFVVKHFGDIKEAVGAAWSWITGKLGNLWDSLSNGIGTAVSTVKNKFGDLKDFLEGMPAKFRNALSGLWDNIGSGFKSSLNAIIRGWNSLHISLPKFTVAGKTFGGGEISMPNLPLLAQGGTVLSAGGVIVGDRGAEVLDLPRGARVTPLGGNGGAGGGVLRVEGEVPLVVRDESGRELARKLLEFRRVENGNLAVGIG